MFLARQRPTGATAVGPHAHPSIAGSCASCAARSPGFHAPRRKCRRCPAYMRCSPRDTAPAPLRLKLMCCYKRWPQCEVLRFKMSDVHPFFLQTVMSVPKVIFFSLIHGTRDRLPRDTREADTRRGSSGQQYALMQKAACSHTVTGSGKCKTG